MPVSSGRIGRSRRQRRSAPTIAGVAALMLDKNPSLSNADATFGTMPALLFDVVRPAESYAQALALLQAQP